MLEVNDFNFLLNKLIVIFVRCDLDRIFIFCNFLKRNCGFVYWFYLVKVMILKNEGFMW